MAEPEALFRAMVDWYDLGEVLLRQGAVTPEALAAARGRVAAGEVGGLFEALDAPGVVEEGALHRAYQQGMEHVSLAFMLLKTDALTLAQLEQAFDVATARDASLPEALQALGLWDETKVAFAIAKLRGDAP